MQLSASAKRKLVSLLIDLEKRLAKNDGTADPVELEARAQILELVLEFRPQIEQIRVPARATEPPSDPGELVLVKRQQRPQHKGQLGKWDVPNAQFPRQMSQADVDEMLETKRKVYGETAFWADRNSVIDWLGIRGIQVLQT